MHLDPMSLLAAALAQASGMSGAPAPAVPPERDFRGYVFAAYGAVVILLLIYTLWLSSQSRSAEKKLDHLQERLGQGKQKG